VEKSPLLDGLLQMSHAQKPLISERNALKRHPFMLSTSANPIDGLRFERRTSGPLGFAHPEVLLQPRAAERSWQWQSSWVRVFAKLSHLTMCC
jgi:hypothetical protein